MGKGRMILLSVIVLTTVLLLMTGCEKGLAPELIAAQDAVAAAKADGAQDLCPEEFQNAELKLKQAMLLYEDNEDETAKEAAIESETLGKEALECSQIAKQPTESPGGELPSELASFKEQVFFNFNDNSLLPGEAKKLFKVANFIKKFQKEYKFYVVLEAHADRPGLPEVNQDLTSRRAKVVRYYLNTHGINDSRFVLKPMGEVMANEKITADTKKKEINKKEEKYRRVDISIIEEKEE